jgi:hypothetical protein
MPSAIPTPFDIIDPAPDALVPSAVAWLSLLSLAALVYLAIALLNRRASPRSAKKLVLSTLAELQSAAQSSNGSANCERIARLSRRVLSTYLKRDIGALSPNELSALAKQLCESDQSNEIDASASIILELISQLEDSTYAPDQPASSATQLILLAQKVVTALETHVRRFDPK